MILTIKTTLLHIYSLYINNKLCAFLIKPNNILKRERKREKKIERERERKAGKV